MAPGTEGADHGGRRLGDGGAEEALAFTPAALSLSIDAYLVDAYCRGDSIYMPDAKPGVPEQWRSLRKHELRRSSGVFYEFTEYLPDVKRLGSRKSIEGITDSIFASLVAGLKTTLGRPSKRQKQRVEFTWGGLLGTPTWGGVRIQSGATKEIPLGGGDSAPWGTASFSIQLMGAPR